MKGGRINDENWNPDSGRLASAFARRTTSIADAVGEISSDLGFKIPNLAEDKVMSPMINCMLKEGEKTPDIAVASAKN